MSHDSTIYAIALCSPPPKRLGYEAIHARTFTQVGHMLPSLVAITLTSSSSVVYHILNLPMEISLVAWLW